MTIQMLVEEQPHYLAARYTGSGKIKEIEAHHAALIARCQQQQISKCLLDFTQVQIPLSTTDRYLLGRSAQTFGLARIKVAALALPSQVEPTKFAELVAQNSGAQVQVFMEEPLAVAWLLAND